jgi:hypothetical protein
VTVSVNVFRRVVTETLVNEYKCFCHMRYFIPFASIMFTIELFVTTDSSHVDEIIFQSEVNATRSVVTVQALFQ